MSIDDAGYYLAFCTSCDGPYSRHMGEAYRWLEAAPFNGHAYSRPAVNRSIRHRNAGAR